MTTAPPDAGAGPADPPVDRELKRERFGWYSYDWAMSVFNTSVTTVFLGPYLTAIARGRRRPRRAAVVPRPVDRGRQLVLLRALGLGPPAGARAAADRRGRRPHRPQARDAGRLRVPRRARDHRHVLRRRRPVAAGRRPVRRRQHQLRRGDRRLLLLAARPGRPRRAGRRLQPRLGLRLRRRRAAARRPPRAGAQRGVPGPDHRRGGADLPGDGGPVVGRLHRCSPCPGCATGRCAAVRRALAAAASGSWRRRSGRCGRSR